MNPISAGESVTDSRLGFNTTARARGAWMEDALELLQSIFQEEYQKGIVKRTWALPSDLRGRLLLPEWRTFYRDNYRREMQYIARNGVGLKPSLPDGWREEVSEEELRQTLTIVNEAYAKSVAVGQMSSSEMKSLESSRDYLERVALQFPLELTARTTLVLKDYRVPLEQTAQTNDVQRSSISGVLLSRGHLWGASQSVGAFELNEKGEVLSEILFPKGSEFLVTGEDGAWDVSQNYFAAAAFQFEGRKESESLAVYDRQTKKWKLLPYHSQGRWDNPLRIFGDNIVYSFEFHPDSTEGVQVDKDMTRGIMMVNIRTGQETLIASTHRKPAQSPLDKPCNNVYKIRGVSEGSFHVNGWVYDIPSGKWSPEARGQGDSLEASEMLKDMLIAGGRIWRDVTVANGKGLRFASYKTTSERVNWSSLTPAKWMKVTLPLQPVDPVRSRGGETSATIEPAQKTLNIRIKSSGLLLWDNVDCYFIPATKVRAIIEDAMKEAN